MPASEATAGAGSQTEASHVAFRYRAQFYVKILGATERLRLNGPNGTIAHAEISFGTSVVMLADEMPGMGALAPATPGGSSVSLNLYVTEVDAVVALAVAAGATLKRPVTNQFYGDRVGSLIDPFGHLWHIATHVEDVAPQELQKRMAAMMHKSA